MLLVVMICWLLVSIAVLAICVTAGRADAQASQDALPLPAVAAARRFVRR